MRKLIGLELKRIHLRPYMISVVLFALFLLGFTYFVAYVAQIQNEVQFMNYTNIFRFRRGISILLFGVLSAVMYNRLILTEYTGRQLVLLFCYPGSRRKIFCAKVLIVFSFVLIAMLVCAVISTAIFALTEYLSPIVPDTLTRQLLTDEFNAVLLAVMAAGTSGLLAMQIGFWKRSATVTLISACILSAVYGNLAISDTGTALSYAVIGISFLAALAALYNLSRQINHMEAK